MNITIANNILIVELKGDVDHNSSYDIKLKIDEEIKKNPITTLILDMNKLEFMDSSGIGLILGRYKLLKSLGGTVVIVNPSPHILKIINMSGLHKIIYVYNSMEEAISERGVLNGKYSENRI